MPSVRIIAVVCHALVDDYCSDRRLQSALGHDEGHRVLRCKSLRVCGGLPARSEGVGD